GVRVGFKMLTLSGEEGVLSHVEFRSQYQVGKYKVDADALEDIAANSLIRATTQADLIIIDEIGKMELFSELMRLSIVEALASGKKVLATVDEIDDEFVGKIKKREDVEIIKVTPQNRDSLVDEIIGKLTS
ncbi:nucleoside-triphosphatase, partial [Candidatus Margulisiibacteriota bacterium]